MPLGLVARTNTQAADVQSLVAVQSNNAMGWACKLNLC